MIILFFNNFRMSNKMMSTNRYSSILNIPEYFNDYINFGEIEYVINFNDQQ